MGNSLAKRVVLFFVLVMKLSFSMADNLHFSRLIVFGDSYSDNGNVFKLTQGQSPNSTRYYEGRYSDGLVWSEYLATNLRLDPTNPQQFIDYAYGNAKVDVPVTISLHNPEQSYTVPSFSQQITLFQKQYGHFKPDDLVTVFISANDVFDLPQREADFQKLANQEVTQIKRLIGLKAQHIIVLNNRNVSASPLARLTAAQALNSSNQALINQYIKKFKYLIRLQNKQLAKKLSSFPEVILYNTYQFDKRSLYQIKKHGINYSLNGKAYRMTNGTNPCYQNLKGDYQGIAGPVCNDPYNYYFYDRIHTTSYANYLLAKDVYQQLLSAQP